MKNKYNYYVNFPFENRVEGPMALNRALLLRQRSDVPAEILMIVVDVNGNEVK